MIIRKTCSNWASIICTYLLISSSSQLRIFHILKICHKLLLSFFENTTTLNLTTPAYTATFLIPPILYLHPSAWNYSITPLFSWDFSLPWHLTSSQLHHFLAPVAFSPETKVGKTSIPASTATFPDTVPHTLSRQIKMSMIIAILFSTPVAVNLFKLWGSASSRRLSWCADLCQIRSFWTSMSTHHPPVLSTTTVVIPDLNPWNAFTLWMRMGQAVGWSSIVDYRDDMTGHQAESLNNWGRGLRFCISGFQLSICALLLSICIGRSSWHGWICGSHISRRLECGSAKTSGFCLFQRYRAQVVIRKIAVSALFSGNVMKINCTICDIVM